MTGIAAGSPNAGGVNFLIPVLLQGTGFYGGGPNESPNTSVITPSTYRGATVRLADCNNSWSFRLELPNGYAQSFFRYVLVQTSAGTWRQFSSAAATYLTDGATYTRWIWEAVSNQVWNAAATRAFVIY